MYCACTLPYAGFECPPEQFGGILWPATVGNMTAVGTCPDGFTAHNGVAPLRACGADGVWFDTVVSSCDGMPVYALPNTLLFWSPPER